MVTKRFGSKMLSFPSKKLSFPAKNKFSDEKRVSGNLNNWAFTRNFFLKVRNKVTKRFGTKMLSFPAKNVFPATGD